MAHIDVNYYKNHGGDVKKPPYIDTRTRKVRVFVSALWYPTWAKWKAAADVAVETAVMGVNPVVSNAGISISEAAELDPVPSFIFSRKYGDVHIWLNAAAISDEADFDAVLVVAEAKRRLLERNVIKNAEFTKYDPAENGTRSIADNLNDREAAQQRNISRLLKHEDESREKLIREIMRAISGSE